MRLTSPRDFATEKQPETNSYARIRWGAAWCVLTKVVLILCGADDVEFHEISGAADAHGGARNDADYVAVTN